MKQKDIALIVIIVFFSAIISLFVSQALFASPKNRKQQAEVVQAITADFPKTDKHYFNNQAFDPTKEITIEKSTNTQPFNDTTQ